MSGRQALGGGDERGMPVDPKPAALTLLSISSMVTSSVGPALASVGGSDGSGAPTGVGPVSSMTPALRGLAASASTSALLEGALGTTTMVWGPDIDQGRRRGKGGGGGADWSWTRIKRTRARSCQRVEHDAL